MGTIAALTLLLGACESPNEIGLEVLPGDVPAGATLAEYPATHLATVAYTDSLLTANKDNLLVGRLVDAGVGATVAEGYTQVEAFTTNPDAALPALGVGRIDSLVLTLPYTGFSGSAYPNEPARRLRVEVRELGAPGFVADQAYYGDSPGLPTTGDVLGEASFTTRYQRVLGKRHVLKNRIRTGDPAVDTVTVFVANSDTSRVLQPLRVPLKTPAGDALAQRLYRAIGTSKLASLAAFQEVLRGFAITPKAGTAGAIVNLQPYAGILTLHYHRALAGTDTAAQAFVFAVGGESREVPRKRFFSRLNSDFAPGSALQQLAGDTAPDSLSAEATGLVTYVQAGVELGTRLQLPGLDALRALKGHLLINRAELYVPIKPYATGVFGLPGQLYAYQADNLGRLLKTDGAPRLIQNEGASQTGTGSATPLVYDASQNAFRGLVTGWLQAYVDDRLPDARFGGLVLRPTLPGSRALGLNRALVDAIPGKVRLKVYYSTLQ